MTDADIKAFSPESPQGGSSGHGHGILESQKGNKVVRKLVGTGTDGQNEVSQVVSWHASFIDTASDATKKLNVSGLSFSSPAGSGQVALTQ